MPIINISVTTGRDPETLRTCLQAVHDAIRDSLHVPDTAIRVLLTEIPPSLWSSGGITLQERTDNSGTHTARSTPS